MIPSASIMHFPLGCIIGTTSSQSMEQRQPSPPSFSFSFSILPSRTVLTSPSCLSTCPIYFCCLLQMVSIRQCLSPTLASTSSFVTLSVRLILFISLQNHISQLSSLLMSAYFNVQVSEPYRIISIYQSLDCLFIRFSCKF